MRLNPTVRGDHMVERFECDACHGIFLYEELGPVASRYNSLAYWLDLDRFKELCEQCALCLAEEDEQSSEELQMFRIMDSTEAVLKRWNAEGGSGQVSITHVY